MNNNIATKRNTTGEKNDMTKERNNDIINNLLLCIVNVNILTQNLHF